MNKVNRERIAFVDYIRVIACLLVMVIHASEQFYNMGSVSQVVNEDNRLWVSVYDGFFGRISVPLFMIVSAFLLVPMKAGTAMGQSSVVYVSTHQHLPHHPRGVTLARKGQCEDPRSYCHYFPAVNTPWDANDYSLRRLLTLLSTLWDTVRTTF